jgi:hypothetical protein
MTRPPSPIPIITLDDTNPMDGQESSYLVNTLALLMNKVTSFPSPPQDKKTPLVAQKLFDPIDLQSVIKLLSTNSWSKETIEKKKRKHEEAISSNEMILKETSSLPPKKKK